MRNTSLIHRLAFGIWAMDPARGHAYMPMVTRVLRGEMPAGAAEKKPVAYHDDVKLTDEQRADLMGIHFLDENNQEMDPWSREIGPEVRNLVAVLPVNDVILKYDAYCGPYGMETIARWYTKYDRDPRISGLVLDIDSPGGEGDAMNYMVQAMSKGTKRVLASINSGMAASAAYGIACATDGVYVTGDTDMVGSIGTYVTLADWKAWYESEGLPMHEIYASKSTEKNLDFRLALEGKYEELRKNFIDPFNEGFLNLVKKHRASVKAEALTGRMFYADEAKEMGLIDGKLPIEAVAALVRTMSKEPGARENGSVASHNQKTDTMNLRAFFGANKQVKLGALSGVKAAELTTEQLAEGDTELAEAGIEVFTVAKSDRWKSSTEIMEALSAAEARAQEAEAQRDQARTEQTERMAGIATSVKATLTELGIEPAAEETTVDTALHALRTAHAEVKSLREQVEKLEKTDTTDGLKGPENVSGDREETINPELQALITESNKAMQRMG